MAWLAFYDPEAVLAGRYRRNLTVCNERTPDNCAGFSIVGNFDGPGKLSWKILRRCEKGGISTVPVSQELTEVLGVALVSDTAHIPSRTPAR